MNVSIYHNHPNSLASIFVFKNFIRSEIYQKEILDCIKKNTKVDKMKTYTNVKATMSGWDDLLKESILENFFTKLIETLDMTVRIRSSSTQDFDYKIADCWAMKHEKNDFSLAHSHYPFHWSAAYYAQVPNKNTTMYFYEINRHILLENNSLFLFPGLFEHSVQSFDAKQPRYSLACNVSVDNFK